MAIPKGPKSRGKVAVRPPRRKPKFEQQIGTAGRSRRPSRKPVMK